MSVSFSLSGHKKASSAPKRSTLAQPSAPSARVEESSSMQLSGEPLDPVALVNKLKLDGNTLAEAGHFVRALSKWDEALSLDPTNPVLQELKAQVLMELGEDDMALECALQAISNAPTWTEAHLTLGRVYLNSGLLDQARVTFKNALQLAESRSNPFGAPEDHLILPSEVEQDLDETLRLIELKLQIEESHVHMDSMPVPELPNPDDGEG